MAGHLQDQEFDSPTLATPELMQKSMNFLQNLQSYQEVLPNTLSEDNRLEHEVIDGKTIFSITTDIEKLSITINDAGVCLKHWAKSDAGEMIADCTIRLPKNSTDILIVAQPDVSEYLFGSPYTIKMLLKEGKISQCNHGSCMREVLDDPYDTSLNFFNKKLQLSEPEKKAFLCSVVAEIKTLAPGLEDVLAKYKMMYSQNLHQFFGGINASGIQSQPAPSEVVETILLY